MSNFLESKFVDQRTGFFRALVHEENLLRPIAFHAYSPVYSLRSDAFEGKTNSLSISGAGMSREEAKAKCLGEAIERYCWYYASNWMEQRTTTFNEIRKHAIAPSTYGLFSNSQYAEEGFPFIPFREDTELNWVEGVALADQKRFFVPAQLCCPGLKDGRNLSYYTTTGLACSENYFKAAYTSICEVIERDAFMLMWTNRIKPQMIAIQWQGECGEQRTLQYLNTSKYECLIFSLYTDIAVPVVVTVMANRKRIAPYLSFGAACDCDWGVAVRKSVSESLHNLNYLIWADKNNVRINWERQKTKLKSFDEHALLYSNWHFREEVSFILSGPHGKDEISLPNVGQDVDYEGRVRWLIDLVAKEGYQTILVDLTPKEIKDLGYCVIKALIPGFMDLGLNTYYWLGNRRIYEVPRRLGFKERSEAELNTFPHPFP
jgi:ribosomal protein S12 methylthiotransferase accessory factor